MTVSLWLAANWPSIAAVVGSALAVLRLYRDHLAIKEAHLAIVEKELKIRLLRKELEEEPASSAIRIATMHELAELATANEPRLVPQARRQVRTSAVILLAGFLPGMVATQIYLDLSREQGERATRAELHAATLSKVLDQERQLRHARESRIRTPQELAGSSTPESGVPGVSVRSHDSDSPFSPSSRRVNEIASLIEREAAQDATSLERVLNEHYPGLVSTLPEAVGYSWAYSQEANEWRWVMSERVHFEVRFPDETTLVELGSFYELEDGVPHRLRFDSARIQ